MSKEHSGLKYVRSLRIKMSSHNASVSEGKCVSATYRLLVNIPKHALTQLEYGSYMIYPLCR
jgi:hypothetical protein